MRSLAIRSSAKVLLDFVTRIVALRPVPARLLSLYYFGAQSGWSKFSKQRRMNVCVIRSKASGYMEPGYIGLHFVPASIPKIGHILLPTKPPKDKEIARRALNFMISGFEDVEYEE
ncbi:predicted protein [Histoplasma capsulatum H143]|uniref:Uncharacterized protein n=1 Tax=Ajellomyces capsulatus (strain H143) TaxID=544712 RepID=C6HDD3_AJECH|nr:predicted protein [Histoplasma capsulatum H143]